ncbi:MAG: alpha/beta fold hydrolase [Pseudomonadota bacterium]
MNAPLTGLHPSLDITFVADVATLHGRVFLPLGTPKAAIVLHGATAVPARYYHAFAAWLSTQGYACLTYDYRGFGSSAIGHVRASDASLVTWGIADQPAAQAEMECRFPGVPLWVIGHSIGGLMVPFHPGAARIKRLITVASGPVHTSDHPGLWQLYARIFWWGPPAWAAAAMGYLPGRAMRLGDNVPRDVYWQWRRWCTTPGFYLTDVGRLLPVPDWHAFQGDLRVVAVEDDGMVPPPAAWRLMQHYPEAWKRQTVLRPAHGPIGHITAFAERNRALWPQILG